MTEPIAEELQELYIRIKENPTDVKQRVYLFQLLCIMGQWERAQKQLKLIGELDPEAMAMVNTYNVAIACEHSRQQVFSEETVPSLFGETEQWMHRLVDAFVLTKKGCFEESQTVRIEALEAAPALAGAVDGQPFTWFADLDTRLAYMLEAIVGQRYHWIPFHQIREIRLTPPKDLRDLVWLPAHFVWLNGEEEVGLIPTRYPGSEANSDEDIRMARKTEWRQESGDVYIGQGQRMFATESGDYALLDTRQIRFEAMAPNPQ